MLPLASKIVELRKEKCFTQYDAAVALGISQEAYSRKECGYNRFRAEHIVELSKLFNVCILEFFWEETDKEIFKSFLKTKNFLLKPNVKTEIMALKSRVCQLEEEQIKSS